jgi:hypothetical protein
MARGQKLHDAMSADEARPAGNQNCAHCRLPSFSAGLGAIQQGITIPILAHP